MSEIENNSSWFPWGRLIIGTLIGGFFTTMMSVDYTYSYGHYNASTPDYWPLFFIFTFVLGLIPMLIVSTKDAVHKEAISWITFLSMFCPFALVLFLAALIWAIFGQSKEGAEKAKEAAIEAQISPFKTEIVNNAKYLTDKKTERMKYLNELKKETVSEIAKKRKELEKEHNKINSIPVDAAKYLKQQGTTTIDADISKLESKLLAIDALINAETVKKSTSVEKAESELDYDDDED